jgi:hypothetical protein
MVLILGSGGMILFKVILCVMLTSFWLPSKLLIWMQLKNLFGTYRFPWSIDFCLKTLAWHVTYENKPGHSRHHHPNISFLRLRLWRCWISSTLISLLQHFWLLVVVSPILDWFLGGWLASSLRSPHSVYLFNMWSSSAAVLYATHFAHMFMGLYETKEITDYLETQSSPFFRCWTRLKSIPTDGWRWQTLL